MNSPGRNPLGLVSSHNHGPIPLQASIQRENLPTGDTDKRTSGKTLSDKRVSGKESTSE